MNIIKILNKQETVRLFYVNLMDEFQLNQQLTFIMEQF